MEPLEFRLIDEEIGRFKAVFNTVPAPVLGREQLMLMDKSAMVIDLASEPGGTDFEAAKELGITAEKALDAKVTVAARRCSDLAWIRSEGMEPLEFRLIDEEIGRFKAVFNTVPAPVLGREQLMLMDKSAMVIDLASEPGGTDFEAAKELGITAEKALGLPGKFAPKTAGEIVKDTVLNIIAERRNEHER
ncbi:MAG: hypothetical protein IJA06_05855, partial [Oscillospiraceae bacterium]|nr:hypothetical protein [Oscillospiraceae bacterium]